MSNSKQSPSTCESTSQQTKQSAASADSFESKSGPVKSAAERKRRQRAKYSDAQREAERERKRKATAAVRASQPEEKRQAELDRDREAKKVACASQPEEKREAERERKREAMALARASQPEEKREAERERKREATALARASQPEEKREAERERKREAMALARASQPEEKREAERERKREATALARASQPEEKREAERERKREAMALARASQPEEKREAERERKREATALARASQPEEKREAERERKRKATSAVRASQPEEKRQAERERDRHATANQRQTERRQALLPRLSCIDRPFVGIARRAVAIDGKTSDNPDDTMKFACRHCSALHWKGEKTKPKEYSPCCREGRVNLQPLPDVPDVLRHLLTANDQSAREFRSNIRAYNSVLAFTSIGAAVNDDITSTGRAPYTFRLHGELCHRIGTLERPARGEPPKFAQLYIYDPEHEIDNRLAVMPTLRRETLAQLQQMLHDCNPFVAVFRQARDIANSSTTPDYSIVIHTDVPAIDLRRYNLPTVDEVAAIIPGDGSENVGPRDIVLRSQHGPLHRITESCAVYDPLHYVLLFPHGSRGWTHTLQNTKNQKITMQDYAKYRLAFRPGTCPIPHTTERLFHQYAVDCFARIEQDRLNYIRYHQKELRAELYSGLCDAVSADDNAPTGADVGQRIILPSSFTNSPRQYYQLYQDAMSVVRAEGKPDLFITVTCNPRWPMIQRELLPGQTAADRPDICVRVFKQVLRDILRDINQIGIFARKQNHGRPSPTIANIHVIEFRKRGLPHAHMLIILAQEDKPRNPDEYNDIVCAELPQQYYIDDNGQQQETQLWKTVTSSMLHGPCGIHNPNAPCMIDGKCSKKYPREYIESTIDDSNGYPTYRRRKDGRSFYKTISGKQFQFTNEWVVPYNPHLCQRYDAHINVEICSSVISVKYLYKYVYKGPDRAVVSFRRVQPEASTSASASTTQSAPKNRDEVETYLNCRYIAACEALWRIFDFSLHAQNPNVVRLQVHLPDQQQTLFSPTDDLATIVDRGPPRTTLTEWFEMNAQSTHGRHILYHDFVKFYTWNKNAKRWARRKVRDSNTIGRVFFVQPSAGELFYLRLLLINVPGAQSYQHLRTVDEVLYDSFREAAQALGVLEDDAEWRQCLQEASGISTGQQLRNLFAIILIFCTPINPYELFFEFVEPMSEDLLHRRKQRFSNAVLDDFIINKVLRNINETLTLHNKTLSDFQQMPTPPEPAFDEEDFAGNDFELDSTVVDAQILKLNDQQRRVFDTIRGAAHANRSILYFLDAPGGTGKSFVTNVLIDQLRLDGFDVLPVASSGIAALILHGGRTAHSRFKIPIAGLNDKSTCSITKQSKLADQLRRVHVIVWDEATMANKLQVDAVDRTLRDICSNNHPFGGKVLLFAGDFRQVLPVVRKGSRAQIVLSSLKHWHNWHKVHCLQLEQNMRIQHSCDNDQVAYTFSSWLLRVGNGTEQTFSNDAHTDLINMPASSCVDSIDKLIQSVFPDLSDERFYTSRAIVAPTNDDADIINTMVMRRSQGPERIYKSVDSAADDETGLYPVEFLNTLQPSGMPPHCLTLKPGSPVMLLRNLNPNDGLCNGTRLICRSFDNRVIEAEVISGTHVGTRVFIPRITLCPSDSGLPFTLCRRQFPLRLCYAMTINKSQSQTMDMVGIYLPRPVFSHGQFYVACSRVGSPDRIKIYVENGKLDDHGDKLFSRNVVYTDVL